MIINTRIDASKLRTQHIADVSRIFTLASCLPLASRELAAQLMEDPDLSADAAPAADADDESLFSKQGTGQLRVFGAKKIHNILIGNGMPMAHACIDRHWTQLQSNRACKAAGCI